MNPKNITIGILSLGCPKNLVDSEVLLGYLEREGFSISFDVTQCDIALINTCSFVEDARQEALDMIAEVSALKREGRIRYLVVCGCLPQRYPQGMGAEMPDVDAFVGTGEIDNIAAIINNVMAGEKPVRVTPYTYLYSHDAPRVFLTPPFVKYVKIAEGCNHVCSFCVIPEIRGAYRSREFDSIVTEVRTLAEGGLKECVLIAQDTSYYGQDSYGTLRLAELLNALAAIEGIRWLRPLYLHPKHITEELIDVFKSNDKVCKYIDIPLQHINDGILKSMRRGMQRKDIVDLIQTLRREIPGVIIRSSLIVGYPGEGYEEFNELLDFVDEIAFDRLGVFMYSHEKGSSAHALADDVLETVKKSRFQDIMLLQQKISRQKNKKLKNRVFETLIEGYNEDRPDYFIGRTYMDAPEVDGLVYIKKGAGLTVGEFYPVKITDTHEYDLVGEVQEKIVCQPKSGNVS